MSKVGLTRADVTNIRRQGREKAHQVKSAVRKDKDGNDTHPKMHISLILRGDEQATLTDSMPDAWQGSKDISKAKAHTALAFSSNENALTTRTIGELSQPGKHLWQIGNSNWKGGIIEFPGGVPLYKNGELVGAVGVSGDGVDQDETVAVAASEGFEAPSHIRSDNVIDVSYVGAPAEELPKVSTELPKELSEVLSVLSLPPVPSSPLSKKTLKRY